MTIDYISDLHLDFYKPHNLLPRLFSKRQSDVLVVAGDISHTPQDFKLLDLYAEEVGYKKVFATLGNHDGLIISNTDRTRYKSTDVKEEVLYEMDFSIMELLNGTTSEYNNIIFGGAKSFYDGSLAYVYGGSPMAIWQTTMICANRMVGVGSFMDVFNVEKEKLDKMDFKNIDVMITHVAPLSRLSMLSPHYQTHPSSMFYTFDGQEYLDKMEKGIWISGHIHHSLNYEYNNIRLLRNAQGYPGELGTSRLATCSLNK